MTKDAPLENKKKLKYTNLLDNIGKNNKINTKEAENNYFKNNNIKISSSITNYQNKFNTKISNVPNNVSNIGKEKKIDYLYIPKSNSINNVLKFNNLGNKNIINNNLESKTPNRHPISIFGKINYNIKMNQRGKKSMLYDLIKGIGISNTGRIPNIINSAKPSGIRNHSTCQRKKK